MKLKGLLFFREDSTSWTRTLPMLTCSTIVMDDISHSFIYYPLCFKRGGRGFNILQIKLAEQLLKTAFGKNLSLIYLISRYRDPSTVCNCTSFTKFF